MKIDDNGSALHNNGDEFSGPQLLSYRNELIFCRPASSAWEKVEEVGALIALHLGNVIRQVLRPVEPRVGILASIGMTEAQRPLVDYRPAYEEMQRQIALRPIAEQATDKPV